MIQVHFPKLYLFAFCSCLFTGISSEYDYVQKRVAHQSVSSMDSACSFSCNQKVRDFFCKSISINFQTTILVVQSRVDYDRHFSHINAIVHVHTEHCRDSLLNSSLSSKDLNHRSIQPYTFQSARNLYATAFLTLTDNTGSIDVTGFQRVNIGFSVCIYKLRANGTNFLCYQCAKDLGRINGTSWMVLDGILIKKGSTCSVTKYKTICGCAVVVRGRESLIVHSSCSAGCNDNCFCSCNGVIAGFHVKKNSTCSLSFFIFQKFYSGSKFYYRNAKVQNLVTDSTHDFRSGIILCSMHSLSGGSTTVRGDHGSIVFFVELNAKIIQPFNCIRSFHYKSLYQLWLCSKMSAAEAVQIMLYRRIVFFVSCLDSAFCHHGVGITDTKLGHDHYVGTCIVCFDGTG